MNKMPVIPKQARSKKRVENILSTSKRLMLDVGFDQMTVSSIAKASNVPVGTFYQFFPSKHALLQAIGDEYLTATKNFHLTVLDAGLVSLDDYFSKLLHAMIRYYSEHGDVERIFESNDPLARKIADNVHRQTMQYLKLAAGQFVSMPEAKLDLYCRLSSSIIKPILLETLQDEENKEYMIQKMRALLATLWRE